jgi:hypothetical protein
VNTVGFHESLSYCQLLRKYSDGRRKLVINWSEIGVLDLEGSVWRDF